MTIDWFFLYPAIYPAFLVSILFVLFIPPPQGFSRESLPIYPIYPFPIEQDAGREYLIPCLVASSVLWLVVGIVLMRFGFWFCASG